MPDDGEPTPSRCRVRAWRPSAPGISEVFHAHMVDYAYPAHCHDTWTLLIVETGAIRYELDTHRCGASGQVVAILPPGVVHDGRPAAGATGFSKRNLYLEPSFLPDRLIGAAVDRTNLHDPVLRAALSSLHDSLLAGEDPLDGEGRLGMIGERVAGHLSPRAARPPRPEPALARQLRDLLDDHFPYGLSLAGAAQALGRSVPHLVRSFAAAYGVSPHGYLIGRRIEVARRLLLQGLPAARVAVDLGFYDQAHFNRHFRRHTSVPPARYAASQQVARGLA